MSGSAGSYARGMTEFIRLALRADVLGRAFVYAGVVGAILIAINHGDRLLEGDLDARRGVKLVLTPVVPFFVSLFSSASALRSQGG